MKDRIYRKLSISDLPLVMQFKADSPSDNICEDNARQFLNNPMNWMFACIQDNRIIGHATGYELNNLHNSGNKIYINSFGVFPQYRRQGVGTGILTNLKETCRLLGIYKIFLITEKSNSAACKTYEKAGGKFNNNLKDDDDYNMVYTFNIFD